MSEKNGEKRPRRAMGQFTAEAETGASTTIVGGQPQRKKKPLHDVPVGVEKVLCAAATDEAFRSALLADRDAALDERGFELRASERAMLRAIPAAQLERAIESVDTSPENIQRRSFMRAVAATTAAVVAADVIEGCGYADDGSRPDPPPDSGPQDSAPGEGGPDQKTDSISDAFRAGWGIRPGDVGVD